MALWTVLLTDRSTRTVTITETSNPRRDQDRAEHAVRELIRADAYSRVSGLAPFAAKPAGCSGFAWNVHFGAENACMVHRNHEDYYRNSEGVYGPF